MQDVGGMVASLPSVNPAAQAQIAQQMIEALLGQMEQDQQAFEAAQMEQNGPILEALMQAVQAGSVAGGAEGALPPAEPASPESLAA